MSQRSCPSWGRGVRHAAASVAWATSASRALVGVAACLHAGRQTGGVPREPSPREAEDSGRPVPSGDRASPSRWDSGLGTDGRSESGLAGETRVTVRGKSFRTVNTARTPLFRTPAAGERDAGRCVRSRAEAGGWRGTGLGRSRGRG